MISLFFFRVTIYLQKVLCIFMHKIGGYFIYEDAYIEQNVPACFQAPAGVAVLYVSL